MLSRNLLLLHILIFVLTFSSTKSADSVGEISDMWSVKSSPGYVADNENSPSSKNCRNPKFKRKVLLTTEIKNSQDFCGQTETETEAEAEFHRDRRHFPRSSSSAKQLPSRKTSDSVTATPELSKDSTVQRNDVQTTTVSPQQSIESPSTSLVNVQEILTAFALIIVLLYLIYCIYYLTLLKDIYKEDCGEDEDEDEDNGDEEVGFKEVEMDFHNFIE